MLIYECIEYSICWCMNYSNVAVVSFTCTTGRFMDACNKGTLNNKMCHVFEH